MLGPLTAVRSTRRHHVGSLVFATLVAVVALVAGRPTASRAASDARTCDIYARAGTPCVAAHSTTRALFAHYDGPLYRIARRDDRRMRDIGVRRRGGVANAAAQDAFCAGAGCVITRIYDQTARHNDLTIEGAGGAGATDRGAVANALPVFVDGRRVYGLFISAGMGYRDDATQGVASHGQPETMYMVTSGTHANDHCCFDYGNAEVNNKDTGNGHMDAVNFSTLCSNGRRCYGAGPWVQADLENGLFMSAAGSDPDASYTGNHAPFVTALLKNDGRTFFALRSGDARRDRLRTIYRGHEPLSKPGYSPMQQEGAIVLGTGGDNSNGSIGSFFEGVMTAGVTKPAADQAVQAEIARAGYRLRLTRTPLARPR